MYIESIRGNSILHRKKSLTTKQRIIILENMDNGSISFVIIMIKSVTDGIPKQSLQQNIQFITITFLGGMRKITYFTPIRYIIYNLHLGALLLMNTKHYFHFKDRYVLFLFMRTDCKQCNATRTVVSQVTVFRTAVNRHI